MKLFVTGGAGFIGSNFIRLMLNKHSDCSIINIDLLTYAGCLENLEDVSDNPRYSFIRADINDFDAMKESMKGVDAVINFAAESHVDRSIDDPSLFLKTNVFGTYTLLQAARENRIERFIQISTDEVYGSLGKEGLFSEKTPLAPNSPYSASKASADFLVRSYFKTYGFPSIITRCSNNYGPFQFPEKFIPLMITNAIEDRELPVYGDGLNIRDWIYVDDHCRAIETVLFKGKEGEVYNIGGNCEKRNIDIVKEIVARLGKSESLIKFVKDRPGHDRRYAMDSTYIKEKLGWEPKIKFEEGIELTIKWYKENKNWWQKIKSGEYREYYEKHYLNR